MLDNVIEGDNIKNLALNLTWVIKNSDIPKMGNGFWIEIVGGQMRISALNKATQEEPRSTTVV